jgi:hypothetical protein
MAVDTLRSCYTTRMRFYRDSDRTHKVRWFFCDAKAKRLPFYTVFASGNWLQDHRQDWPGVGEVKGAPRTWNNGLNRNQKKGNHACGTADMYARGLSIEDNYVRDPNCCKAPLVQEDFNSSVVFDSHFTEIPQTPVFAGEIVFDGRLHQGEQPQGSWFGNEVFDGRLHQGEQPQGSWFGNVVFDGQWIMGSGVVTACCPFNPTPPILNARCLISASVNLFGRTWVLVYNAAFNRWESAIWVYVGAQYILYFRCDGTSWEASIDQLAPLSTNAWFWSGTTSTVCEPFNVGVGVVGTAVSDDPGGTSVINFLP